MSIQQRMPCIRFSRSPACLRKLQHTHVFYLQLRLGMKLQFRKLEKAKQMICYHTHELSQILLYFFTLHWLSQVTNSHILAAHSYYDEETTKVCSQRQSSLRSHIFASAKKNPNLFVQSIKWTKEKTQLITST